MISGQTTAAAAAAAAACEGSDSNSIVCGGGVVESACMAAAASSTSNEISHSVRYKGVMLQQNGHWGAQIYARGHRIWLGTFKSELAAAAAYDSAAIKLHHGDSHRNLPASPLTVHEHKFQEMLTTEEVLDMIKTGSYEARLEEYIRRYSIAAAVGTASPRPSLPHAGTSGSVVSFLEMFVKELTPSDVGKLNRLVIPKKHATQYFPQVDSETADEVLVEFVDREERPWTFRYCYWKSSQSYVFTKGWNKFVKEKRVQAKDAVAFYRCEERDGLRRTYYLIDIIRRNGGGNIRSSGLFSNNRSNSTGMMGLGLSFKRQEEAEEEEEEAEEELSNRCSGLISGSKKTSADGVMGLGPSFRRKVKEEADEGSGPQRSPVESTRSPEQKKQLKLFGTWII